MPFKLKLIKNFQKYLTAQQTNLEEEKKSSTVATSEPPLKLKYVIPQLGTNNVNSYEKLTVCSKWPSERHHFKIATLLTFSTFFLDNPDGDPKRGGYSI